MVYIDDDFTDAKMNQSLNRNLQKRRTFDLHESLRAVICQRAKARTQAGSENHGFHKAVIFDEKRNKCESGKFLEINEMTLTNI